MPDSAKLSFQRQEQILSALAPLVDNAEAYACDLKKVGFKSFIAWAEHDLSFCECHEIEEHRTNLSQFAKRRISAPNGLLRKKDEPVNWQDADPCIKRYKHLVAEHPEIVQVRLSRLHSRFLQLREVEMLRVPQPSIEIIEGEIASLGYASYFSSVLIEYFHALGFSEDRFRSRMGFPVISKPLTKNWDICWSPESNRTLQQAPMKRSGDVRRMSDLDLICYVRSKRSGGFVSCPLFFDSINFMIIRLNSLVHGFLKAYSFFDGVQELGILLSAHAHLYKLVGPQIEATLSEALIE